MGDNIVLEDEATKVARENVWDMAEAWALQEGIDYDVYQRARRRLDEIGAVIGEDRLRAIWTATYDEVSAELAEMARQVVRPDVVDDWLASRVSKRPAVPPEELSFEWPDSPPPEEDVVEFDPQDAVRDGLGRVMRANMTGLPVEDVS